MDDKKAPKRTGGKTADVIELASRRAQPTGRGRRDRLRELELAADALAQSPRAFDRQIAELVDAAMVPGVSFEALRLATARLELSAQGRPCSAFSSRTELPENAGVDERIREADRLLREASAPLPERLPFEGNARPILRVCEAAWIAGRNMPAGEREDLFRRWLAQTECDLAKRVTSEQIAELSEAFSGGNVKWKAALRVLRELGFRGEVPTLKQLWAVHRRQLIQAAKV